MATQKHSITVSYSQYLYALIVGAKIMSLGDVGGHRGIVKERSLSTALQPPRLHVPCPLPLKYLGSRRGGGGKAESSHITGKLQ